MANLMDRIGFIRGLLGSVEVAPDSARGKLYAAIADALEEVSAQLGELRDDLSDLTDFVENIDEDLEDLEAAFDGEEREPSLDDDDFDEDYDDEDYGEGGARAAENGLRVLSSDAGADEGQPLAGSICTQCGKLFFVPLRDIKEENELYTCPHCHKPVDFVPIRPENAPIAKPFRE